jgi:hypothetical protein
LSGGSEVEPAAVERRERGGGREERE